MSFYADKSLAVPFLRKAWSGDRGYDLPSGETAADQAMCRLVSGPQRGQASFGSALANLVMSVLGAGQLTLPFVLSQMGVGLGCLALLCCGALSAYSCRALVRCSRSLGVKTYSDLLLAEFGRPAKVLADALIAIYAWGGGVSFLLIVKGQLAHATWLGGTGSAAMASLALGVVLPLSLMRDLDRLKFSSGFGCAAAVAITAVVIATAPWDASGRLVVCDGSEAASSMRGGPASYVEALAALPLVAFALNSSWAFLNVFGTLDQQTQRERGNSLIIMALSAILANYFVMSVVGYASYCDATTPNILDSLRPRGGWQDLFVAAVRGMLVTQLVFALPLRFNVARCVISSRVPSPGPRTHVLLTVGLVASAAGLAACPLRLNVAIGVTSAVCASFIIYIFPAALELSLMSREEEARRPVARGLVAVGVVLFGAVLLVAGTAANVAGGRR